MFFGYNYLFQWELKQFWPFLMSKTRSYCKTKHFLLYHIVHQQTFATFFNNNTFFYQNFLHWVGANTLACRLFSFHMRIIEQWLTFNVETFCRLYIFGYSSVSNIMNCFSILVIVGTLRYWQIRKNLLKYTSSCSLRPCSTSITHHLLNYYFMCFCKNYISNIQLTIRTTGNLVIF